MKNFFDCKDEKITEKAFSQSLIISVVSILLCLVALCSMTYAWFTSETMSSSNTLTSGYFKLESISVTKTDNGGTATAEIIAPTQKNLENGTFSYTLDAGTYLIVISPDPESTAKGYCTVKIGGLEKHTDVIIGTNTANKDGFDVNAPLEFSLVVTENDTVVEFSQHWGISASSYISDGMSYTHSTASGWQQNPDASPQDPTT